MNFTELLRTIQKEHSLTQTDIANATNLNQARISAIMRQYDIKIGTLHRLLGPFGYKIMIVRGNKESYELEGNESIW